MIRFLIVSALVAACTSRSGGSQTAAAGEGVAPDSSRSWRFVPCAISSLAIYSTDRLPASPMELTVTTTKGERSVTMTDGYRVLYVLPPDEGMLNTKTEQLRSSAYRTEKLALIDNLQFLASSDSHIGTVQGRRLGALDSYLVSRDVLEGGTIAIAELFDDTRHRVTTIYFLNADSTHRHFQSVPEFVALRDGILNDFGRCPSLAGK